MPRDFQRFQDAYFAIPFAFMGIILFCVIYKIVSDDFPLFEDSNAASRILLAFCITGLALYGFDQMTFNWILAQYAAMGATILGGIAFLIKSKATGRLKPRK